MAPTPERPHLSLALTVQVDPPHDAGELHRLGDRAATRVAGHPSRVMASFPANDQLASKVTWTLPLPAPEGEPLGSVLSRFEAAAHHEAAHCDAGPLHLRTLALEALTLEELEERARRQQEIRTSVIGVEAFTDLLGVSRQRLYELAKHADFPRPIARGVWLKHMAEGYAAARETSKAGRPPAGLTAFAHPEDLDDDGVAWIRIHDENGAEADVVSYDAHSDRDKAWANIRTALARAQYRVLTPWRDPFTDGTDPKDFRGPRATVARGAVPTTSYGTWDQYVDGEDTLEANVAAALQEYASNYEVESLTKAYRAAINEKLAELDEITLVGNEFHGPYPRPGDVDSRIRPAVEAVDFWELAEKHERDTVTYEGEDG